MHLSILWTMIFGCGQEQIIEKIENFGGSFSHLTIETVKTFLVDSKKSKFKI